MAGTDSDRYYGDEVAWYEERRRKQRTWRREHARVREALWSMSAGSRVLDVPVGTGRFFGLYQKMRFEVVGVDISADMLAVAGRRAEEEDIGVELRLGSILSIPAPNDSFDVSVCVRMMQWLSSAHCDAALRELARVTRGTVLVTIHHRLGPPRTAEEWITYQEEDAKTIRKRRLNRQTMSIHDGNFLKQSFATHGLVVKDQIELVKKPGWSRYDLWILNSRT